MHKGELSQKSLRVYTTHLGESDVIYIEGFDGKAGQYKVNLSIFLETFNAFFEGGKF